MRACYSCPQRGSCEPRRRHGDDGIGDPPQPLDQRARALSGVRGTRRLAEHLQDVVADALPIVEHRHLAGVRGSECAPSTTSASPGGGPCGNRSRAVISGRKTLVVRIPYGVLTPIGHKRHLGDVAELGENADRRQTGERRTGDQTTSMSPARPGPWPWPRCHQPTPRRSRSPSPPGTPSRSRCRRRSRPAGEVQEVKGAGHRTHYGFRPCGHRLGGLGDHCLRRRLRTAGRQDGDASYGGHRQARSAGKALLWFAPRG